LLYYILVYTNEFTLSRALWINRKFSSHQPTLDVSEMVTLSALL
jgi:hypothetical protein